MRKPEGDQRGSLTRAAAEIDQWGVPSGSIALSVCPEAAATKSPCGDQLASSYRPSRRREPSGWTTQGPRGDAPAAAAAGHRGQRRLGLRPRVTTSPIQSRTLAPAGAETAPGSQPHAAARRRDAAAPGGGRGARRRRRADHVPAAPGLGAPPRRGAAPRAAGCAGGPCSPSTSIRSRRRSRPRRRRELTVPRGSSSMRPISPGVYSSR